MIKQKWTSENIMDQTGKIIIVTGSSSGIGYEAARVLANKGAEVVIAVRNHQKGEKAAQKILDQNPATKIKVMILDLASLKSVKEFADAFRKQYKQLNLLINNAGVMIPPYGKTEDGFEMQFGTNHLGHFALTAQLLPLLEKTKGSRIVNISSIAHKYGNIDFNDPHWEKRRYIASRAYGDSKIANLYFTYLLATKLQQKGSDIKILAAHPGWTATELQRHSGLFEFLNNFFAMSIEQGALPTLRAACDENAQNGDYFGPNGFMEMKGYPVKVESNKLSHDTKKAEKLWEISEQLTKVHFGL